MSTASDKATLQPSVTCMDVLRIILVKSVITQSYSLVLPTDL